MAESVSNWTSHKRGQSSYSLSFLADAPPAVGATVAMVSPPTGDKGVLSVEGEGTENGDRPLPLKRE